MDNKTFEWGNATFAVTDPKLKNDCDGFTGVTTVYDVTFPSDAFLLDNHNYEVCFPLVNDTLANDPSKKSVWVTDLLNKVTFPEKDGEPVVFNSNNLTIADLFNSSLSNGFTANFEDKGV